MVHARSIGQRAAGILSQAPVKGQVLACFERAWDLISDDGSVLALAWDDVQNGPFNILLDSKPGAALPAGTRFVVSEAQFRFTGPAAPIDLASAALWEACPDWTELAAGYGRIQANLPTLTALLAAEAPANSLARLHATSSEFQFASTHGRAAGVAPLSLAEVDLHLALRLPEPASVKPARDQYRAAAARAIMAVQAACHAAVEEALGPAVAALCGLGPGLTPAGDDWLAGWLLGLRLVAADPASGSPAGQGITGRRLALACAAVQAALPRTTALSRAFLVCAAQGEASAGWHALLNALAYGGPAEVGPAARLILAQGATSGADMLAGFLASQQERIAA